MKKNFILRNLAIIALLIFTSGLSAQTRVERNLEKEYNVAENSSIIVNSKFGEVKVLSWEKNSVKVTASIWVTNPKESTAQNFLEKLDVEIGQSGNEIFVKSVFPDKMNTGKDTKFQIDFTIHAPKNINLDIDSRYGTLFIDENSGIVSLDVRYGNATIGTLTRGKEKPLNEINLAYSTANIEQAGWLKMDNSYSKANIAEARAIVIISKYSGLSVEDCSSIVSNSKYDSYRFGILNNFNGELKYSNIKIEELSKKFEYTGNYSSVNIDRLNKSFELVKIDNTYGGVKIGIDDDASFRFSGTAVRADIIVPGLEVSSKKVENTTKIIEGNKGNNPTSSIEVITKQGNVKFYID